MNHIIIDYGIYLKVKHSSTCTQFNMELSGVKCPKNF